MNSECHQVTSAFTLEFWPYPFKDWNSDLIFSNMRILSLSLIPPDIGILSLSFQTLEFWPYTSKHWNSDIIPPNIGILTLSFETFLILTLSF